MPHRASIPALTENSTLPSLQVRRRSFLKFAGASVLAAAASTLASRSLLAAPAVGINLGSGDIGVLNFAYALEQLEALFYSKVTASFYSGISSQERQILLEIRDHEVAHRNFFKKTLGSAGIPQLEFDFSSVDFRSRESVLQTAKTFEDTGVGAYNGAGQLLRDPNHLLAAGRIVSVEARHAATLRDLLAPRTAAFAGDDIVDAFGLGAVERPSAVLRKVAPYFRTAINADNLPRA
ncbi:MAG: ferritin-like domain-containing protein [Verrucomicrobiota bacterium]|nr:ferritin-like domain-containing protein [Verrucomicrobiota bacterium]